VSIDFVSPWISKQSENPYDLDLDPYIRVKRQRAMVFI